VVDVTYSPDKKLLAVVDTPWGAKDPNRPGKTILTLFDATTYKAVRRIVEPGDVPEAFQRVCFAPDGRTAYLTCRDGAIYTYDVATGAVRKRFDADSGLLGSFTLSPDGKQFVTFHYEAVVGRPRLGQTRHAIWDANTFQLVRDLQPDVKLGSGPVYSPDGKVIAFGYEATGGVSEYGVMEIDSNTRKEVRRVAVTAPTAGAKPAVTPVCYSSDGNWLIMGGGEAVPVPGGFRCVGFVRVWDRSTGAVRTVGHNPINYLRPVLSADGKRMYIGTRGTTKRSGNVGGQQLIWSAGEVHCWDTTTWKELWSVEIDGGDPWPLVETPSGRRLWVVARDGVSLLDTETGKTRGRFIETMRD
jgi:WD40 repeat protein